MNGHATNGHATANGKPFLKETLTMTEEPSVIGHSATAPPLQFQSPISPSVLFRQRTVPSNPNLDPSRRWTQEDQDQDDDETRKKIMKDLERSWMDRLQLISVITTFFAAIEAQLLGITTPGAGEDTSETRIESTANATLVGALVVHVFAAILSFLAAFFLVRYRLKEATREEVKIESGLSPISTRDMPSNIGRTDSKDLPRPIWSSRPQLEAVGPFRRGKPPTHLLDHCHTLCMWLAATGFLLAMAGVVSFAWARLPRSGSIFASACMAVCFVMSVGAVFFNRRHMGRSLA
ncbi:hypothetical protein CERSUDRAFT_118216 [Gelatoporia subvermispora B]|uniref:Uncharacterized protein n=1 Tax=Ceriporiopsis subvermispora (strain B) TaxID=914234 RepID=M2PBZ3_CERS8|nr:hypothetical protein CERSUDRAFT_118216 [Gelatoporia subvermispora B]